MLGKSFESPASNAWPFFWIQQAEMSVTEKSVGKTGLWGGLLEFQRNLDRAAEASDVSMDAFVAVHVGQERWLIDLSHLVEASVPPPLSRTGRSPEWVLGIGSLRGQVYTIIDMQRVLLNTPTVSVQHSWVTPLQETLAPSLALLWPEMVGLVSKKTLKEEAIEQSSLESWVLRRWQDEQENTWQEFDVGKFARSALVDFESKVAP